MFIFPPRFSLESIECTNPFFGVCIVIKQTEILKNHPYSNNQIFMESVRGATPSKSENTKDMKGQRKGVIETTILWTVVGRSGYIYLYTYVYVLSVYNIAVAMENGPFSSMICLSMVLFRRPRGPLEVPKAQAFRVLWAHTHHHSVP